MSSFHCPHCGTAILDSPRGYVTECRHYPLEKIDPGAAAKRAAAVHAAVFAPKRLGEIVADGLREFTDELPRSTE